MTAPEVGLLGFFRACSEPLPCGLNGCDAPARMVFTVIGSDEETINFPVCPRHQLAERVVVGWSRPLVAMALATLNA